MLGFLAISQAILKTTQASVQLGCVLRSRKYWLRMESEEWEKQTYKAQGTLSIYFSKRFLKPLTVDEVLLAVDARFAEEPTVHLRRANIKVVIGAATGTP